MRVQQVLGAALARRDDRGRRRGAGARASPSRRLAIAPVLVTGAIAFAADHPVDAQRRARRAAGRLARRRRSQLALAAVPVAFLVGLLRTRLARAAVADLVVELGGQVAPGALRAALARALRDPSLTVAYWLADGERFVDADGRPVTLPDGADRAVTVVRARGPADRGARARPGAGRRARARRLRRRGGRARARERAPAGRAARPARGAARLARADRRGGGGTSGGGSSATCTTARSSGSCRSR